MQSIHYFSQIIEKGLGDLTFPAKPSNLYDPLRYFLDLGGKRMRPMLTLMSADAFNIDCKNALPSALAIELFHNFSLIHDDIMDEAPIRRGKDTVHSKWNQNIAILSGDVLLVKAYQELAKQNSSIVAELLTVFNKTAVEVCEGQQMDMDFESRNDVTIAEYIEMIRLKTSVLLGCALEMGAIVAETSLENKELIYEFGQHIGIAFQIQDDILDLYADPEKFGKQVGGDVISNKKTLLFLKAFEIASDFQKEELTILLEEKDLEFKVIAVRHLFDGMGIKEKCKEIMQIHYSIAKEALHKINISTDKKKPLFELAAYLMDREI
ncbi:MAG: polyprenyl synthetase family protein [Flavobacteriia bacterium]|nr:polyprenyl synthetase family protein [Flavobacteriia bacterium]